MPGEPEGAVWYATGDGVQGVVSPLRDLKAPAALAEPGDTGGAEREVEAADCPDRGGAGGRWVGGELEPCRNERHARVGSAAPAGGERAGTPL